MFEENIKTKGSFIIFSQKNYKRTVSYNAGKIEENRKHRIGCIDWFAGF